MTTRDDSAEVVSRIERDQLFVIPLDNRREWYRYHHLFADVLEKELHHFEPARVAELHRRAARWYADHDFAVEAVQHALASRDIALAAELVVAYSMPVCWQGQVHTVLGWFIALGEELCRGDARLAIARALVAGGEGDLAEMSRWVDFAEQAAASPGLPAELVTSVQANVALARWASAYFAGDVAASVGHVRAMIQFPADDRMRRQACTALGWSLFRQGKFREAQAPLSQAILLSRDSGDDLIVMTIRGIQAIVAAASGLGHEAESCAAQAERSSQYGVAGEHFYAWGFHFARGWLALGQHEAEQAQDYFQRALELLRRGSMRLETAEVLTALAMTERQLGRIDSAREYLREARWILEQCPDPGQLLADPRTIRLPRPTSTTSERPGNLSDREAEVLGLLGEGLTTDDIAHRLRLSPRTVDAHLRSIYRKINVKTDPPRPATQSPTS